MKAANGRKRLRSRRREGLTKGFAHAAGRRVSQAVKRIGKLQRESRRRN